MRITNDHCLRRDIGCQTLRKKAVDKSWFPRAKWATKRTLACIEVRSVVFLESFQLERRLSISSGAIVRIVLGRHGKTCALGNEKSGVFCFICVSFPRGFVVVLSWFCRGFVVVLAFFPFLLFSETWSRRHRRGRSF